MKPAQLGLVPLVLLLVVGLLVQTWRVGAQRSAGRRNAARARRLGVEGEARAEALLAAAGFRVIERQVSAAYALRVDGRPALARVRADFLVERRGRRFVADAKRGPEASSATKPATRRQLLEYRHAYAVDGVLLVDAERGAVHEIEVEGARATGGRLTWLLLGTLLGGLLGALVTSFRG